MFQNILNTMSTTRGVTFFAALLIILIIVAAPFDAVLGAAEQAITACPTPRSTYDASTLANPTHVAGEVPPPGHGTRDESEINANTLRRIKTEESGPAEACPAVTGSPTACARSIAPLSQHVSSPGTGDDKERGAEVMVPGGGPPRQEQFRGVYDSNRAGLGSSTTKSDDAHRSGSGGRAAGPGVTAKVGTTSLPAPPSPLPPPGSDGAREDEGREEDDKEDEETNGRVVVVVRRPAYLFFWSAALSIVSVGGVGVASVLRAGGGLCPRGARASSHRRWLRSAMVGLAVVSSGGGVGVSAADCTASTVTCCEVAIPKLDPLTTTMIDKNVCNAGT